jgi:ribosome-binding protein aMBF1 (putative translation factor)
MAQAMEIVEMVPKRPYHNAPPQGIPNDAPRDEVKVEFARKLQRAIVAKGWNQSELSRRANIGRDSISVYIRGKAIPGPNHLAALAKALGTSPMELLPGRGVPQVGDEGPPLSFRDMGGGMVQLRINMTVPTKAALEVLNILKRDE